MEKFDDVNELRENTDIYKVYKDIVPKKVYSESEIDDF